MKKIALLTLTTAAVFSLTGCGMLKTVVDELQKTPDQLPMTQDEARKALTKYSESHMGLELSYMFRLDDTQGTGFLGQKNGNLWEVIDVEDQGRTGYVALKQDNGSYDYYVYDNEKEGFVFDKNMRNYEASDLLKYFGNYCTTNWLLYAHSQQLSKKGTSQILGRNCSDYEFTYGGIATQLGEDATFLISVDDELCITMKIEISSASSSSRMNMDMTAFKQGDNEPVQVPEVLEKTPDDGEPDGGDEGGEE